MRCTTCGTQSTAGESVCSNCGNALTPPQAAAEGAASPGSTAQPAAGATPAPASNQGGGSITFSFDKYPVIDIVRDVVAVVLLLFSLAFTYDVYHDLAGRWWMIIAVLIAAASVAVPYLLVANVVPNWTGTQTRLVKAACLVPLLIGTLVALINELININSGFGGIGLGIGAALAGGLLALQPRAIEADATNFGDDWWYGGALGLIGGGLALYVLTRVIALIRMIPDGDSYGMLLAQLIALAVIVVAIGWPLVGFFQRDWTMTLVLYVIGAGMLLSYVFLMLGSSGRFGSVFGGLGIEKIEMGIGLFLVLAGLGAAVARPIVAALPAPESAQSWVDAARAAALLAAIILAGMTLFYFINIFTVGSYGFLLSRGAVITAFVFTLLATVAVGLGWVLLGQDAPAMRLWVVIGAAAVAVVGIIVYSVLGSRGGLLLPPAVQFAAWYTLPAFMVVALLLPPSVRQTFPPLLPQGGGSQQLANPADPAHPANPTDTHPDHPDTGGKA